MTYERDTVLMACRLLIALKRTIGSGIKMLIAAYTDDTLMSIIVLEEALKCEDSGTFKKNLEKRFAQLF